MKSVSDFAIDGMPNSMCEIAEIIGKEGAITLIQEYGGTRIFVPRKLRVQNKLATLLGIEQALKLSQHFGGETLNIVRGADMLRQKRNREIIQLYDSGKRVPDLARAYNLTERRIYDILSSTP
ncbi:MAG: hypothetical protein HQM00_16120 [Magnetococcales bacterium]|nr:hypothetical protein [Magnetococcales bacterium]